MQENVVSEEQLRKRRSRDRARRVAKFEEQREVKW